MTTNGKPTAGEWRIDKDQASGAIWITSRNGDICDMYTRIFENCVPYENWEANSKLILEANVVYHETGLMPREVMEQRNELREALKLIWNSELFDRLPTKTAEAIAKALSNTETKQ